MVKGNGVEALTEVVNSLLEKVVEVVARGGRGKILDLGCGDGKTGHKISNKGFEVHACDMDAARFLFHDVIPFKQGDLGGRLPYEDGTFDAVILMEVIEHVYNPDFVIAEISRVLKKAGTLVLSTPNILNIGSRFRFLCEGSYDFFREPTLDYARCFPAGIQNMHVIPWRYQELEYLLERNSLSVAHYYVDQKKANLFLPALIFRPILALQSMIKAGRTRKKGGVDYSRMNRILLSWEILQGKHLILEAVKR